MLLTSPLSSPLKNPVRDLFSPAGGSPSLTAQVQALFAAGRVGGMWDYGDTSTLYTADDGSVPVSGNGDTIGMVLDKSNGALRGSEILTNGSFDADVSWTKGTSTTISGGVAALASQASGLCVEQGGFAFSVGQWLEISLTIVGYSAGAVSLRIGNNTVNSILVPSANGTYRYIFKVANVATQTFSVFCGSTTTLNIENVSVKSLPGNHATQSTAGSRPLYQVVSSYGCAQFDGTNDLLRVSGINLSATNKVLIGLAFKPNTTAVGVAMEYSTTAVSNIGAFYVSLNESGTGKHNMVANCGGSGIVDAVTLSSAVALAPTVLIDYIDLAQSVSTAKHSVRVNGASAGITSVIDSSDVAGNFGNYDLFLGARSGSSFPSNMNLYRAFVLAGSSTAGEQLILENWLRESCGV